MSKSFLEALIWFCGTADEAERYLRERVSLDAVREERRQSLDAVAWVHAEQASRLARRAARARMWGIVVKTFVGAGAIIGFLNALRPLGIWLGWWT